MSRLALFFTLTLLFISPFASADIPHLISLQGKLTDASDNPISSSTNFVFKIFPSETGGTALWTEFQTLSPDTLGIFSALLGSVTALNLPFNTSYWLEVKVNSEVLSPRTRMGSAGYALRSESPWNATGNDIYTTNAGNVGIGTTAPASTMGSYIPYTKLDILGDPYSLVRIASISDNGARVTGTWLHPYGLGNAGWYVGTNNNAKLRLSYGSSTNEGAALTDAKDGSSGITVQTDGNVGIGTTSPGQKLEVAGNIKITGSGNGLLFPDGTVQVTAAGDLYGGFHSSSQCTLLGGTVITVGVDKICRFNSASCQGPFVQYNAYTTTSGNSCDCGCGTYGRACTTGSHIFSNTNIIETCIYCTASSQCNPYDRTCSATRTQIGCY